MATPACASIANLVLVEVTIAPDAAAGPAGVEVGHAARSVEPAGLPRRPTAGNLPQADAHRQLQVLGKEELALRKRPDDEAEQRITLPCTANGQIASGEVNRYRFQARKGQRLVFSTQARQLIPFIADAVPGWFQPVLALYDARGKEVAYNDDYRFKPDPVILFEVPQDGEYVLDDYDAIYRGREDFVYRVTIGELPFVTSIFPLGGRAGDAAKVEMKGWNLDQAELTTAASRMQRRASTRSRPRNRRGFVSNRVPFALDTLPESFEKEPNNDLAHAQKVTLPIIINGRIDRPDDWDVFQFSGHAGETIVAEVYARRLDSPLDSLLKLTDAQGKLLAFNDDSRRPGGGHQYAPRRFLSFAQAARGRHLLRASGRYGPLRRRGVCLSPADQRAAARFCTILRAVQHFAAPQRYGRGECSCDPQGWVHRPHQARLERSAGRFFVLPPHVVRHASDNAAHGEDHLDGNPRPVTLAIEGRAKIGGREVAREAVPAEDRMQAFLWRHLVPAQDLKLMIFAWAPEPQSKRLRGAPAGPPAATKPPSPATDPAAAKSKFTKQQVASRLRQLKMLFDEGLLSKDFYDRKVAECETAL